MSKKLGDGPIDPALTKTMNGIASALDQIFNGTAAGAERTTGFVLMVFPFGDDAGRVNYISNAERADVLATLKHQLARFEGQPDVEGKA